ncbi:TetR/AcrR family transcriptional regulator [Xenorhabdus szentirmaii]|uniref:TetR/AcrR family transcriptional regulator n=1 Tax=Xenorhabdus szentirmaii TaxID=290112 RepID=A0AAW3YVD5_9GAMM|nr:MULTISPECIES: TetR/AcrR family transcriptional regulator [unclassified Xenorhabdus]MBD2793659.1 TetR/AcrR family transcriptional regulator [Xenorhabdus sp. CUL]MBD2802073.1 TetR/AcrR family transcriptional regulator [Xenorhabdus sp. M]MBD2806492.1 TetR/AcrR family transcriptional regulator [Xenorhabdus sp. ZM]
MAQMGRPRTFNRDEAVRQAMLLFWEHGYESTSLALLKAGIGGGISAPSFYAAFGSKENLFKEVVEYYVATYGQAIACLWDESLSPREALELALRRSAKMQTEENHPKGCMLVLSANTCAPEHKHVQKLLAEQRAKTLEMLTACIRRAMERAELPVDTDISAFAVSFLSFLLGLSSLARDGISFDVLDAAVTEAMCNWDIRSHSIQK